MKEIKTFSDNLRSKRADKLIEKTRNFVKGNKLNKKDLEEAVTKTKNK